MNVLLIHIDKFLPGELDEMLHDMNTGMYVAESHDAALDILTDNPIDVVIFTLRTFADLELLHYLNTSYPQIKVFLKVEDRIRDIINILKDGRYQVFPTSFRLPDLKRSLEAVNKTQDSEGKAS